MSLEDIVRISVTAATAGVRQSGFGIPLVLSADATFPERARTYSDLDGVADDFDEDGHTYLVCQAIFAQEPAPETVVVGRLGNKPTQKWTIDLGSAGILSSTLYTIKVVDETGVEQNAEYTTDGSALESELWSNLTTNFNALTGPTATAVNTGPGTSLVITADSAGSWHSLSILTPDGQYDHGVYMSIVQDHADPGIAADLTAIKDANDTWFAIYSPFASEAMSTAIATWAEANDKMFAADIQDSATVTVAVGGTDFADDLKDAAYGNTIPFYHPDLSCMPGAALLGRGLPFQPGSENWKFLTLATIPVYSLTSTHKTNLEAKNCNFYYEVAGNNIVSSGTTSSGEFIDVVRGIYWLRARMAERIFGRLVNASNTGTKIPYTDPGIAVIEAEVRAQLKEGIDVGLLADDPAPTVTVPKARNVSSADKTARLLRNVKFNATLAGSINELEVSGLVSA